MGFFSNIKEAIEVGEYHLSEDHKILQEYEGNGKWSIVPGMQYYYRILKNKGESKDKVSRAKQLFPYPQPAMIVPLVKPGKVLAYQYLEETQTWEVISAT